MAQPVSQPKELRDQKRSEAKATLLGMAKERGKRALLVGSAAMKLGSLWSLEDVQYLLEDLVDEGLLRRTTRDERTEYYYLGKASVYEVHWASKTG